jgi:protein associated with RNAse G/E
VLWQRGETVVHQEVWNGRLWAARPLTVVEDTAERTLLWIPHGTRRKVPITPPTRPDPNDVHARTIASLEHEDWLLGEHVWDVSSLWILRPEDWYTILVSWRPDGSHLGWYINLQEPMRRNPIGFEAMDLMLDVVLEPDLSWRWKDRDEFEEIARRGIFDPDLVQRIRDTARKVIGDIEQSRAPFSDPWPSWTPNPSWPTPRLPAGWSEIHRTDRPV